MQLLVENGFFGDGLVSITTPILINHYNECLEQIGVEPTALKRITLDGIGWSPEVSRERGKIKYFSSGAANQFGIILTPDQKGLPIYAPLNSFDRTVMTKFFRNNSTQISDLTGTSGLWLDFNQDLLDYQSPLDLLMVESIIIRAYDTRGIQIAAGEQREMVKEFRESETQWANFDFRQKIRDSKRKNGDLRFRSLVIPDFPFTDLRTFHTRAFGGVYVFRDIPASEPLLVLEDNAHKPMTQDTAVVYHIDDETLPQILFDKDLVEVPLGWFKRNIDELERVRNFHIVDTFYKKGNDDVEFSTLNSAKQKQWIAAHRDDLPEWFQELCRIISLLRIGTSVKDIKVSESLGRALMRPTHKVSESESAEKVLLQLIAQIDPTDVERLFIYNRILFYDLYRTWPNGKRRWCVNYLKSRGHPRHLNGRSK